MSLANSPRHEILLPVKGWFIMLSLIIALLLNLVPLTGAARTLQPDFVALVMLYWFINEPQRVGISMDTVEAQKTFSDKNSFDYPLLADVDGSVAEAYGVRQAESETDPTVTTTASSNPSVSTKMWRLRPFVLLPPS